MKALIFSLVALAITAQAHATCAARAGGKLKEGSQFTAQLPGGSSSTQAVHSSAKTTTPGKASNGRK